MAANFGVTQILLLANLIVMSFSAWSFLKSANVSLESASNMNAQSFVPPLTEKTTTAHNADARQPSSSSGRSTRLVSTTGGIGRTDKDGFYFVQPKEGERNFYKIAQGTGTDKVTAPARLPGCLKNDESCTRPGCTRPECRPWGHHYDTIYQNRLGPYSRDDVEPFQFLEVGFFNGAGYDTYREFLPKGECHSIEIACIEEGPREEGKWPWGNFAEKNPRYQQYLDENRLHCGDGNDATFLESVWKNEMKRPDAPPLRIVVDDGAHVAEHMVQTVLFWFPRIEPRGLLIVEDIQPITEANAFRTQFMPQIMKDLHFCGDPKEASDELCFPQLFPLIASIHCEMHICIFERNDHPASEPSAAESALPKNALDLRQCKSMLSGHWATK